ncbi:MAG: hypothetical protein ACRCY3_13475 [Sphingorhabdus sp.]
MASTPMDPIRVRRVGDYAKRMSTHIAYALVVYTLLLIFEVSPQMESNGMSIMPYFILVILVGLAILPCRNLERRWQALDANAVGDLHGLYRREAILLWIGAVGVPTALMLLIWIIP